jgi:hypothetical protein
MNASINLWVFLTLLLLSGCWAVAENSEKTVEHLRSDGKNYVEYIVENNKFEKLLDRIENGDEILIMNSHLFLPWIDASNLTSLHFSLSRALIENPEAVMSLIPRYFSVSEICTIPYVEGLLEVERRHVSRAIEALESVAKSELTPSYFECLGIYKNLQTTISHDLNGD